MDSFFYVTGAAFWAIILSFLFWFLLMTAPRAARITIWQIKCARIGGGVSWGKILYNLPVIFADNYLDPCDEAYIPKHPQYYWRGKGDWRVPTERYKPVSEGNEGES